MLNNNQSDVFRFMVIREADTIDNADTARIKTFETDENLGTLLLKFKEAHQTDNPSSKIKQVALEYINGKLPGASVYTAGLKKINLKLNVFNKIIYGTSSVNMASRIHKEITALNITSAELSDWKQRLNDSFSAAIVLHSERKSDLRNIERAIRIIHIILNVKDKKLVDDKDITVASAKLIIVSNYIFYKNAKVLEDNADSERNKVQKKRTEELKELVVTFKKNNIAIKELAKAYDNDWQIKSQLQSEEHISNMGARSIPSAYNGVIQKFGRWIGIAPITKKVNITEKPVIKNQHILDPKINDNISDQTKERLTALGTNSSKINVVHAIKELEAHNTQIARDFNFTKPDVTSTLMFGGITMNEAPENVGVYVDPPFPGECYYSGVANPSSNIVLPNSTGYFHSLGIGDLQVVKQKLIGYEIGEIAHIENVMATEKRSRNHRTLERTEDFTSFEFEKEQETEKDLQTTTRFELQKEIEESVQESKKKEAGITVSGSYGPSVEFTANANIAADKSSAKSNSLSTSYSKEVVDKSVHRLQEKIKEKRSFLKINELEVINTHSFNNKGADSNHINGVYHWVNKKYEAQLFNYGKRELIEVVIPEPAAFMRYMATSHPKEGTTVNKPLTPGYCVNGKFIPLSVHTLSEFNYLDWVSAFNIEDISLPPPYIDLVSDVLNTTTTANEDIKDSDQRNVHINLVKKDVKIKPGYEAKKAWIAVPFFGYPSVGEIAVGRRIINLVLYNNHLYQNDITKIFLTLDNETEFVPIAISMQTPYNFSGTVEVESQRTDIALYDWKIKTFNSIMNKYEILHREYEESRTNNEYENGVEIQGKNPLENQKIIQNELKRQVITQITGQTFDSFDAMKSKIAPYGYPQQNVEEAWQEGKYIRFIEQAFEWENMQYLFYPYYWGKKKGWTVNSRLEDSDPLFQSFLQAGSCRINIPIRPGFVDTTNTFLSTGIIPWDSNDGSVLSESDSNDTENNIPDEEANPFITIAEEMKAQQGAVYFKSEGTVSLVNVNPKVQLQGKDTLFTKDDENREINIAGKVFMIKSVDEVQQIIVIDEEIDQLIAGDVPYGIGAKAIGVPWSVTIPTSLVLLQDSSQLFENN